LDKNLNLILNLTEGPETKSTSQKVNDSLGQMHRTLGDVKSSASEVLRLQTALVEKEKELQKLRSDRAAAVASGKSTAAIDARGAALTSQKRLTESALGTAKAGFDDSKARLQQSRNIWEKETAIYEREQEKRAQAEARAYKKSEKEREKFINAAKQTLTGLISLAESAALAYASVMHVDDKNVKAWLQWFAAIKSVGQAISGVFGVYKGINSLIKTIAASRALDTAATAANTKAQAQNATAAAAACAAKSCPGGGCTPAGGAPPVAGPAGKGFFAARATPWALTKFAGAVGAGFALGESFNYLRTGETLTSASMGAWNARTEMFKSGQKTEDLEVATRMRRDFKSNRSYNQELDYGQINLRRENEDNNQGVRERLSSRMKLNADGVARGVFRQVDVSGRDLDRRIANADTAYNQAFRAGDSASRSADTETRANGQKMLIEAEDQLIKKMELEIEKKQRALDKEARAQEKILKDAEKFHEANLKWLDKANQKLDKANARFDSMESGLGGMSRSKGKKAIGLYERFRTGDTDGMTTRDLDLIQQSGLIDPSNEDSMNRMRDARGRLLRDKYDSTPGDGGVIDQTIQRREAAVKDKKNAAEGVNLSFDPLIIEQAITVDLKTAQEEQINEYIEKLRPAIEDALKRRDALIIDSFTDKKIQELIQEELQRLEREREAQQ
jgi:hypothetical protein